MNELRASSLDDAPFRCFSELYDAAEKGVFTMGEPLWPGGPVLSQAPGVFPMGTDSILLSDFARPGGRDRVLDLGCGSGLLTLLLLWKNPNLSATALDVRPEACALAEENLAQNHLLDRATILPGDLRAHRSLLPCGSFDYVISNPPYFAEHSGKVSAELPHARADGLCSLDDLCSAVSWALRWGGKFALVFRPQRLCELLSALRSHQLEPKRLRPVHGSPEAPVNLLLLEAKKGGNPGLLWEPDLYLRDAGGSFSQEYRRIYHL